MSCIAQLAHELFTVEAHNNSWRFGTVTDAVAAQNRFTTCDLLEQFAFFNVLCQRYAAYRKTLNLCSGWTTGPHIVLTLKGGDLVVPLSPDTPCTHSADTTGGGGLSAQESTAHRGGRAQREHPLLPLCQTGCSALEQTVQVDHRQLPLAMSIVFQYATQFLQLSASEHMYICRPESVCPC